MRGLRRVVAALLPALLLSIWVGEMASRSVGAQTAGSLRVQVVNGTPGGGSVAGLPISIYMMGADSAGQTPQASSDTPVMAGEGRTDDRGGYELRDLAGPVGARYVVSTTYRSVPYRSEPVGLPAPEVELKVYEPTGDDTTIRVANAGIVILEVDAEAQRIRFLETATLRNTGERTFVPATDGPRGPMGLLRFGLPTGAGNLVVGEGLSESTVIQVDTGFATDLPLPPGDTNVTYAYEMAYGALSEGGYAQVSKNMPYPTDLLRVLAVEGDFRVESAQLASVDAATVGTRRYRQLEGKDLPSRSEITLELRDLPLVLPALRPGNPWLRAGVAGLALVSLLLPLAYARRYKREIRRPAAQLEAKPQTGGEVRRQPAVRRVTGQPAPETAEKGGST